MPTKTPEKKASGGKANALQKPRNGHASDRADQDREDWNFWASVAPREAKWIERSPRLISLNLIRLSSATDRNCCLDFSARYPEESVPTLRALRG